MAVSHGIFISADFVVEPPTTTTDGSSHTNARGDSRFYIRAGSPFTHQAGNGREAAPQDGAVNTTTAAGAAPRRPAVSSRWSAEEGERLRAAIDNYNNLARPRMDNLVGIPSPRQKKWDFVAGKKHRNGTP